MAEEDPQKMFQLAADDGQAAFQKRIEKEKRTQERSRKTRQALRWTFYIGFVVTIAMILVTTYVANTNLTQGLVVLSAFISFIAMTGLFFMGGLAPQFVRRRLSEREQKLLDE